MNKNSKNQILQNVQMDTQTAFVANGDINIYPCPWEDAKAPVTDGGRTRVRYRGGITVEEDGRTRVRAYQEGSQGPHYRTLFETAHGSVQVTTGKTNRSRRANVKVELKFPVRYGMALTRSLLAEEMEMIRAFFMTRKEETVWDAD